MAAMKKIFGPKSKYDKQLPYTYEARIDTLEHQGNEPVYDYYFSDTVCGVVEYLEENHYLPNEVEIFEIFRDKESPIQITHCLDSNGNWLVRPELCESMQKHYIGHINEHCCSYRDRSRVVDEPLSV